MLRMSATAYAAMVAHCFGSLPYEACGLLAGPPGGDDAVECYPTANSARSSRVYTVEPLDLLRADRAAESRGQEILAVFHSHTHTDPFPSPTDIAQAPDPGWRYLVVSLRHGAPMTRAFTIVGGVVTEEPIVVVDR